MNLSSYPLFCIIEWLLKIKYINLNGIFGMWKWEKKRDLPYNNTSIWPYEAQINNIDNRKYIDAL